VLRATVCLRGGGPFFRRFIVRTSAGGFSLPSASHNKRLSPTSIEKKPAGTLSSCSGSSIRFLRFTRVFLSVTCALWSYALSTARPVGRKQKAAGGVPRASRPHQQGFKEGTLAIPSRLARDSSQARFRDRAGLAHSQETVDAPGWPGTGSSSSSPGRDSISRVTSERTGLVRSGEQWLQSFSAMRESPGGKEVRRK
jgi:hypothetical protein